VDWVALAVYAGLVAVAAILGVAARAIRVPATILALVTGLALGRTGFEVIPVTSFLEVLPGVLFHVGLLLGVLGHQLGQGMLRLPVLEVVRRSTLPLLLAGISLLAGAAVLPVLLPDAEPDRSFRRFLLPLSFVLAAFPLLSLRDIRGRPASDVGSVFLVAVGLFGAVYSFAPSLLWIRPVDRALFWHGPVLILGESGALGVGMGVLYLLLTRKLRVPKPIVAPILLALLAEAVFHTHLWLPFAFLGAGIALGRAGEPAPRIPGVRLLFDESTFLLLGGLVFAPDLFRESIAVPVILHAVWLSLLLLAIRARVPGGRDLVSGPGLLFLGLALTVRLDRRMGPLARYTIDFALPAWVVLRMTMTGARWFEHSRDSGARADDRSEKRENASG
jgi:hypothetical protein